MDNKKAQSMSTNTIILLVLGLVILVVLIIGFSTGWESFNKIINPSNVDGVVEDCSSACGLNQKFAYCSSLRQIRINEENVNIQTSCAVLAAVPELGRGYFDDCGGIDCKSPCSSFVVANKKGVKSSGLVGESIPEGAYDVTALASDVSEGQVCYILQIN